MFSAFRRKDNGNGPKFERNQKLVASMKLAGHQMYTNEQIALGPLIGTGGFAKVYHCKVDGETAAVCKVINAEKVDEEAAYLLTNECTIWSKLAHPNIVRFHGMSFTSSAILLVCEFMPEGSLLDAHEVARKEQRSMLTLSVLLARIEQIASGMAHLHSWEPPILHRDLKSANILLDGERLAIADFGLARYQECHKKMTAETGSYRWMAPEVIRHEMYDWRCDVYSFGVLVWEMVSYRVPFEELTPVQAAFAVAKEAKRPPIPRGCPPSISHMVDQCWSQDAAHRPSFTKIQEKIEEEMAQLRVSASGESHVDAPAADRVEAG